MVRQISQSAPSCDEIPTTSHIVWHTLHCELVTPMYGGGVVSIKVDAQMPIRASAIRGQLRSWWRLLAKYKWQLGNDNAIRTAEFKLWGGMSDGDDDGKASRVLLRVKNFKNLKIEPWAVFNKKRNGNDYKTLPDPENWANVPYVLFPAQGKRPDRPNAETPHSLAREGLSWDLEIAFDSQLSVEQIERVWEAVRWWANFGGVGARTRRGVGAVMVQHEKVGQLDQKEVLELKGAKLVFQSQKFTSAYEAWKSSIEKLQSFRQVSVGRKTNSNRSLWSEPDAIRAVAKQASIKHSERTVKCDYFPRAAFGLPIIFKFKDDGNGANDEPAQTSLQPKYQGNIMERMSSPLILRPYFDGKNWQSMALRLPSDFLDTLKLSLKQPSRNQEYDVNFWDKKETHKIAPISDYGADNPLQAFLTYFTN